MDLAVYAESSSSSSSRRSQAGIILFGILTSFLILVNYYIEIMNTLVF